VNPVSTTLALIALTACGAATAQNMPSQSAAPAGTAPPSGYPSSTSPSSPNAPSSDSSGTSSKSLMKQQIKDCMAQQKANNSNMSKSETKKYCKEQVSGSPHE